MKPLTKLYISTFLILATYFGIFISILDLIYGDFILKETLLRALFFGFFMSTILVTLHKNKLEANGVTDLTDDNLKVRHKREVISNVGLDLFISKLKENSSLSKLELQRNMDEIQLETNLSWKSWGEIIKIKVANLSENQYKYQVSSMPKLRITLIDYGKNLENINKVLKLL